MGILGKITQVPIAELVPYENNAKVHNPEQIEKLMASIQEFGFLNPVLIDENKNIIAGHGRVLAAKNLKMETVPCADISGLAEAQRRAYILADNRLAELADWDMQIVMDELADLLDMGFDIDLTGFGNAQCEPLSLDREDEVKNQILVKITFNDIDDYHRCISELTNIAETNNASISTKEE